MKLNILLPLATVAFACPSQAAVGYFGKFYIVTTLNGGANVFNQVLSPANNLTNAGGGFDLSSDGFNPALGSFGTIDLSAAQSLGLKGFEMNTFNNGGDSVNDATLLYRVTKVGDTPGSFSSVTTNTPGISGDNKFWQVTAPGTNLTTGLTNGNYEIDFYVQNNASFTGGGGGTFVMNDWNSSDGPVATFSVIPEPGAAVLGLIGSLLLLRRRK